MPNIKRLTLLIGIPVVIALAFASWVSGADTAILLASTAWGTVFASLAVARLERSVFDTILGLVFLGALLAALGLGVVVFSAPLIHPMLSSWFAGSMMGAMVGLYRGKKFAFLQIGSLLEKPLLPTWMWLGLWLGIELVLVGAGGAQTPTIVGLISSVGVGIVIGGLISALGLACEPRTPEVDDAELGDRLLQINSLINHYQLGQARREVEFLAASRPRNLEVRKARYSVWKFLPTEPLFHKAFERLVSALMRLEGQSGMVEHYYQDYLAVTQGKPELSETIHLELAMYLASNGLPDVSAGIVNLFLRRHKEHQLLAGCLSELADSFFRQEKYSKAKHYAETVLALFPKAPECAKADQILDQLEGVPS